MRLAALAVLALSSIPARAASPAGAAVLRLPLSAQAAALAAFAAQDGGLSSIGLNPAGVAGAGRPELATSFRSGALQDAFGFVGYAHPLGRVVPFGGVAYYNAGAVGVNFSDGTRSTVIAEEDYIGLFGAAAKLGAGFAAGAAARAARFALAQQASATSFSADAGAQWATPLEGLRLGAAVENLGRGVKFEDAADPLPTTWRAGAAYAKTWGIQAPAGDSMATRVTLLVDGVQTRGEPAYPAAGAELLLDAGGAGSVALRVGHAFDAQQARGVRYGIGLREGPMSLDYTQAGAGELGNVQYGTLSFRF